MSAKSLEKGFSVEKAHRTQVELSKHLILEDELPSTIRCVAGTDVAYTNDLSVAAAALLDFDSLQLKESQLAVQKTVFPYIPTLLSFREIRPTIAAIKKLHRTRNHSCQWTRLRTSLPLWICKPPWTYS